jgi:hypothetical protein
VQISVQVQSLVVVGFYLVVKENKG